MELQKIYSEESRLVKAFAESRIGGRSENQDSFGWADTPRGYLVTVCDGMGGGPGGKTASTIAVREITDFIMNASKEEEISNILIKAIRKANMAILEAGNENPSLRGMGSTATVLLITEDCAYTAHVGDSRIYQLRGREKVFRTFDHSMVFEMVEQGIITEEQARLSAQSNVITRALGIRNELEVEVHAIPYEKGDRFLLCSDGIHGSLPEKQLIQMAADRKNKLGVVADNIATFIDNIGRNSGGGHDNLTIAMVQTTINSNQKTKMTRNARYIIAILGALLMLSIACNIFLPRGGGESQKTVAVLRDSVKMQADTIANLRKSISEFPTKEIKTNANK